jgi:hypothetical protein
MSYDNSMKFIGLTKAVYDKAFSSVQIHGCVAGHVPVECFIRQGCPMNMLLFTLALNLLTVCEIDILQVLAKENGRSGIHRRHHDLCDDRSGHSKIRELLSIHGRVKAARLNIRKSRDLVVGSWDTSGSILDIPLP